MRWDLFCRVIDNHGDLGVSWRLACGLAAAGDSVSLWVDDARALSWMAPRGAQGVEVRAWTATTPFHTADVADVVVETFGCELPTAFVQSMVRRQPAPVWVNLEYLSAEGYVDRSHGLPSPRPSGLATWFFYPGFSERSGGLLREPGLMTACRTPLAAQSRASSAAAKWSEVIGPAKIPGRCAATGWPRSTPPPWPPSRAIPPPARSRR